MEPLEGSTAWTFTELPPSDTALLIIDDNPGDIRIVELLLGESDFHVDRVLSSYSLNDGLQIIEKEQDHLAAVIVDLTLPDSYGMNTVETLVRMYPDQNIIVMTGYMDKNSGLEAIKMGVQDFLEKGAFDAEDLAKALRYSTERKAVIKRLEATQRMANIAYFDYDPKNYQLSASEEFFSILKLPLKRHINIDPAELSDNQSYRWLWRLEELLQQQQSVRQDFLISLKDLPPIYISINCQKQLVKDRVLISGFIQDITTRKIAEDALLKSQERYRNIFTNSKEAIYISSLEGNLIECNQATLDLFGVSEKQLVDKESIHTLFFPTERKNEFLLKLKTQKFVRDFELNLSLPNKEVRICQATASILVTDDFIGYTNIVRDITERKQVENLRKSKDLAKKAAEMKEQFIASVSHDMRTPMNAVLGMTNLLAQSELNLDQKSLVNAIKQSSDILLGIVNDILEISAIQNGKIEFTNQAFDLYELSNNLMNVMQFKAAEKNLFMEVSVDDTIPRFLMGDKLRLNQILLNLIGNALKFTDEGHVKLVIEKLFDIGDNVQIKFSVSDTGIGIAEDQQEAVFESFTRVTEKDRLYEGTGLGLSIVKNLVEQQGGKAGVSSALGVGSTFYFDLIFDVPKQVPIEETKVEMILDFPTDVPFRLLLVEDHKMNQLVAKKTLEKKWTAMELDIANHGKEAVALIEKNDYDIVLMDIQMPVMDGYEATAYIRNQMPAPKCLVPILVMTAHAYIAQDTKYLEYGMNDYVLKPFEPDELHGKISRYLSEAMKKSI